ncbi:N-formylglutamate amidohydrolase [Stappia sp. ES.058]|uniref:N-formylglutamate amidohydrolase n=1 Tax=Stappia sp. ES.058 TaxID=1881061 RepID=UPI00087C5A7E|nr:N-formylglutamate amidohydrolase [Stappia sp. ES.058]SDU35822.1 Predicted N-formylglutamate amidohydrolase [Stappia sp. ES.058]
MIAPVSLPAAPHPDVSAVESLSGDPGVGLLILCDHAGNAVPKAYDTLGLPKSEFERHIAYDIGARALTFALAAALSAPAVLSTFSRLLIDPNRGEDDPTLIMRLSDGAVVPGNARHDAGERERRLAVYHRPYHSAVEARIDAAIAAGHPPTVLSVHSFTPVWRGVPRPWHAGVLWDRDPRFAVPLRDRLRGEPDLVVGDNEPYGGALKNDCMFRHGTQRGLAHALLEVRQDLIGDARGVAAWADRLVPMLRQLLDELPDLATIRHYGSGST